MPRKAAILACAAVSVLFLWQAATVRYNYGGNWTGLFCIRPGMPVPQYLKGEHLYVFKGSEGYDGQIFHLIAHDPWMKKGTYEIMAGSSFRYQRIFVPEVAWILALGDDRYTHAAYFAVILGFVFLGVYWSSRYAWEIGLAPAWGLMFAVIPATVASVDRMVSDVALAAFAVGFALYARPRGIDPAKESTDWRVFVILACAALTRETALPIIGGYGLYLLTQRRWRDAMLTAATVAPMAAWFAHVSRGKGSEVTHYVSFVPLAGFFDRVIHPFVYPVTGWRNAAAQVGDYVAVAAVALGLIFAARIAMKREWTTLAVPIYACTAAIVFLGARAVWEDPYAFGRVLTPFLLLIMLHDWKRNPWLAAAPLAMISARLSMNLSGQVLGIVHALVK